MRSQYTSHTANLIIKILYGFSHTFYLILIGNILHENQTDIIIESS